ncbi:MAG TPA: hypothetical protein VGC78_05530 [Gaiellaceae bacterium]|jgi:hypothetical protein
MDLVAGAKILEERLAGASVDERPVDPAPDDVLEEFERRGPLAERVAAWVGFLRRR